MSALPNLSALRLGQQGPELDTGGRFTTYHGRRLGVRRTVGRFKTKHASGHERCAVSLEDFKPGDPIWAGENGQYYYPWEYYRAARSNKWRDPMCGDALPVTPRDRRELEYLLRKVIPKKWKEYANDALRVLDDSLYASDDDGDVVDFGDFSDFDDEDDDVELPPLDGATLSNPGFMAAHWDSEDYGWQDLPPATASAWTPMLAARTASWYAEQQGREYLWTSPLANRGRLTVDWYSHESALTADDVPGGRRSGKRGEFTLTMPLVDTFKLTNLLRGMWDTQWSVVTVQDAAGDILQQPDEQRGSRDALRQTALRALLMGNRRAPELPTSLSFAEALYRKLSALDFYVDFALRTSGDTDIFDFTMTVSVSLMQTLLNNPEQLEVFVATEGNANQQFAPPATEAGWGNFADEHVSLVGSNGIENVTSETDPFTWPGHWKNAFVRMVQAANNLTMIVQGFEPQPIMQDYLMVSDKTPFAIDNPTENPETAPEYFILTTPTTEVRRPPTWSSSTMRGRAYKSLLTASMPFWYGILDSKLDEYNEDFSFPTVNGRYGRYVAWSSRPRRV
jgi:hypothetical protein